MIYGDVIKYLDKLPPFVPVKKENGELLFDLKAITELTKRLGNPQDYLKCVHVTGTNGKGSVVEFLSGILIKSGYNVGTFTSPYLKCIREQTKRNGIMISEQDFSGVFSRVIEVSKKMTEEGFSHPSEFEMSVAASFLYFYESGCDLCVIEVGLGGEYDATNIINNPLLCVFTPISRDHMMVLGEDLEKIASVKSGIIKNKCICITAIQEDCVYNVLKKKAESKESVLETAAEPSDIEVRLDGISFKTGFGGSIHDFNLMITGRFQAYNAAIAVYASYTLKKIYNYDISLDSVRNGLLCVRRPGRFDVVSKDPLVIVDGAHNIAGVTEMLESLKMIFPQNYHSGRKFIFVSGFLADKEYEEMLRAIVPLAYKVFTVTPCNIRALGSKKLAYLFESLGAPSEAEDTAELAMIKAKKLAKIKDMPVVVFGSLYYIGKVI